MSTVGIGDEGPNPVVDDVCPGCGTDHGAPNPELDDMVIMRIAQLCEQQGIAIPKEGVPVSRGELRTMLLELMVPDPNRQRWDGWDEKTYKLSGEIAAAVLHRVQPFLAALDTVHRYPSLFLHPDHAAAVVTLLERAAATVDHLAGYQTTFVQPESNLDSPDMIAGSDDDRRADFIEWLEEILDLDLDWRYSTEVEGRKIAEAEGRELFDVVVTGHPDIPEPPSIRTYDVNARYHDVEA